MGVVNVMDFPFGESRHQRVRSRALGKLADDLFYQVRYLVRLNNKAPRVAADSCEVIDLEAATGTIVPLSVHTGDTRLQRATSVSRRVSKRTEVLPVTHAGVPADG
jgi:hypothetical protein